MILSLDHIAIAVPELQEAITRFRDDFGIDFTGTDDVEAQQTTTAFFPISGTQIELIHPINGQGPVAKYLEKRGGGLHHLCFRTDDIEHDMQRLKDKGYRFLSEQPQPGAHGTRVAFIHPKSAGGVLIELAEHPEPVMSRTRVTAAGEQTSLAWRKAQAGQRLFVGFQGTDVNDDLRRIIREIQPAGFVLFRRNVEDPKQVFELNRELRALTDAANPPFLAVDQEGGRVQRVKTPATVWPAMRAVGAAQDVTADVSRAMARELRAMGFNLNFAPVADVDSNPDNPIIGDRSFSNAPGEVSRHITEFIGAHQNEGVIACTKHFPGHGDTAVDSHLDLPWVHHEEAVLRQIELPPFKAAVAAGVGTMMTSHVMYPAWDPDHPATLSTRIVQGILRDELGFNGVVFSDDLEMKAIAGRYSVEEQVVRMTQASVDVFLCCESHDVQMDAFRQQVLLQERFKNFDTLSDQAVKRIQDLRLRFFSRDVSSTELPAEEDIIGCAEHRALVAEVNQRATDNGYA